MGAGGVLRFGGLTPHNEDNAAGHSVGPEKTCFLLFTKGKSPLSYFPIAFALVSECYKKGAGAHGACAFFAFPTARFPATF